MMNNNIIYSGIEIFADVGQAVEGLAQFGRKQAEIIRQSRIFGSEVPRNIDRAFGPFQRFKKLWNDPSLTENMDRFRYQMRNLANEMNSLVMAGVATSMTGVSFLNFGRKVTRAMWSANQAAMEFQKTLSQIKFLGKVSDKDLGKLQDQILKIGISKPATTQSIAEGMLEAMRANFTPKEAIKISPAMADLTFMSMGGLDDAESLKFINSYMKTTGKKVKDVRQIVDRIAKTADVFTTDIKGVWQAWQSSAAAFGNLGLNKKKNGDLDLLSLIGLETTFQNPRRAGMIINSFGRGLIQAAGAGLKKPKSERGSLWNALGIDLDKEDDILNVIAKISERASKLWGKDTAQMRKNLITLFGVEGLPVIQDFQKFIKSGGDIREIRKQMEGAAGYSKKFMDYLMKTPYGTQQILKGTAETAKILMGLTILEPLNKVLWMFSKGLERVVGFLQQHKTLAKWIGLATVFVGVMSTLAGLTLLVGGGFLAMVGSIASAAVTLGRLNDSVIVAQKGFKTLKDIFHGTITMPIKNAILWMARMGIMAGVLYLAYKHNFMGMKDVVENFMKSFNKASHLSTDFSLGKFGIDQYNVQIQQMRKENPLLAFLTETFTKGKVLWTLIKGLWDDNKLTADEVGGEKNLRNIVAIAKQTGMWKLADMILDWRDNIKAFWKGFVDGAKQAGKIFVPIIKKIGDFLTWIYDKAVAIGKTFGFIDADSERFAPKFEKLGHVLGDIVGFALGAWVALKAWRLTLGPIVTLVGKIAKSFFNIFRFFGGKGGPGGGDGGNKLLNRLFPEKSIVRILTRAFKKAFSIGGRMLLSMFFLDKLFPPLKKGKTAKGGVTTSVAGGLPVVEPQNDTDNKTLLRQQRTAAWVQTKEATKRVAQKLNPFKKGSQAVYGGGRIDRAFYGTLPIPSKNQMKDAKGLKKITGNVLRGVDAAYQKVGTTAPFRLLPGHMREGVVLPTKSSKGLKGKIKDVLYGRPFADVIQYSNGSAMVRGYNRTTGQKANVRVPASAVDENGEIRSGKGIVNRMVIIPAAGRAVKAGTKKVVSTRPVQAAVGKVKSTRAYQATSTVISTVGGFAKKRGGQVARVAGTVGEVAGKALKGVGKGGAFIGKALFGSGRGLLQVGRFGGKFLMKGLLFAMKIPFRALPIIGEILMAWDLIKMVLSNWDFIKKGASKAWGWAKTKGVELMKQAGHGIMQALGHAWQWVKTKGVDYLGQFWNWLRTTAIPAAGHAIKTGLGAAWRWVKTKGVEYLTSFVGWVIGTGIPKLLGFMKASFSKAWGWIKTKGMEYLGAFINWVVTKAIPGMIKGIGKAIAGLGKMVMDAMARGYQNFLNNHPLLAKILPGEAKPKGKGHRTGLDNVGRDNYPALLHGGEMVLTRREAQLFRALRGSRDTFEFLQDVQKQSLGDTERLTLQTANVGRSLSRLKPVPAPTPAPAPKDTQTVESGDIILKFEANSIQISMPNATSAAARKAGREFMNAVKKQVELENLRTYRPARGSIS